MRAATPVGPFREVGEEQYAHTPFSEIYLVPQMRAVYTSMCVQKSYHLAKRRIES